MQLAVWAVLLAAWLHHAYLQEKQTEMEVFGGGASSGSGEWLCSASGKGHCPLILR